MADKQEENRMAFLVECFRSAHEELMARIRQREEWFKIGLATQVVILAAMSGFEVFGTKTSGARAVPPTWLPLISMPISLTIASLHCSSANCNTLVPSIAFSLGAYNLAFRLDAGCSYPLCHNCFMAL